jgi:hypothetical protein
VLQDFQVRSPVFVFVALYSSYDLMLLLWLCIGQQVCDVFFLCSFLPVVCPNVESVMPVQDWAGKGFLFHDHSNP